MSVKKTVIPMWTHLVEHAEEVVVAHHGPVAGVRFLQLLAYLAHGNGSLIDREIGENGWLSNIQYENERMGKLVAQLLELARTEDVKPQMELSLIHI